MTTQTLATESKAASPPDATTLYCAALDFALGNTRLALLIRQLHYLLGLPGGLTRYDHHWVWATYSGWGQYFPWSYDQVRYVVDAGRKMGLLATRRTQLGPMLYRIDYRRLWALFEAQGIAMPGWMPDSPPESDPVTLDMFVEADLAAAADGLLTDPEVPAGDSESVPIGIGNQSQSGLGISPNRDWESVPIGIGNQSQSPPKVQRLPTETTYRDLASSAGKQEKEDRGDISDPTPEHREFMGRLQQRYSERFGRIDLQDDAWRGIWNELSQWDERYDGMIHRAQADRLFSLIGNRQPRSPMGLLVSLLRKEMKNDEAGRTDLTQPPAEPKRQPVRF